MKLHWKKQHLDMWNLIKGISSFYHKLHYVPVKLRVILRNLYLKKAENDKVAICCFFQNEAEFLEEWLNFHFSIGVDHIFLYNNQSTDHFMEVLHPYIKKGAVTLRQAVFLPGFLEQVIHSYNDCLKQNGRSYKWIAFLDCDEFMVPKKTFSIKEFLKDYGSYPGVFINWLIFGTSGVETLEKGEMLVEKMLYRCPDEHDEHLSGKIIMQPASGMYFYKNPHFPEYSPFNRMVFADKSPFIAQKKQRKLCIEELQLNHYWYRTEKFYKEVKKPRRSAFYGVGRTQKLEEWHRQRANSTRDESALSVVQYLKRRIYDEHIVQE